MESTLMYSLKVSTREELDRLRLNASTIGTVVSATTSAAGVAVVVGIATTGLPPLPLTSVTAEEVIEIKVSEMLVPRPSLVTRAAASARVRSATRLVEYVDGAMPPVRV